MKNSSYSDYIANKRVFRKKTYNNRFFFIIYNWPQYSPCSLRGTEIFQFVNKSNFPLLPIHFRTLKSLLKNQHTNCYNNEPDFEPCKRCCVWSDVAWATRSIMFGDDKYLMTTTTILFSTVDVMLDSLCVRWDCMSWCSDEQSSLDCFICRVCIEPDNTSSTFGLCGICSDTVFARNRQICILLAKIKLGWY